MKTIAILSRFRDSVNWHGKKIDHVKRFFTQLYNQKLIDVENSLEFFLVEGNSVDETWQQLNEAAYENGRVHIFKRDIAKSNMNSDGNRQRVLDHSANGNFLLEQARGKSDYYIFVESDLIVEDDLYIWKLINSIETKSDAGIIGSLILHKGATFYDTWGYTDIYNRNWNYNPPYSFNFYDDDRFVKCNSVGGSAIISKEVVDSGSNFGENCFRGLCKNIRDSGKNVYTDKTISVVHPNTEVHCLRWI